ncbi:MAG: acetyltransferase, partial [Muribaculaceae bacterium]|nr:acetyltransferase [Muribaculaceae bacterium]
RSGIPSITGFLADLPPLYDSTHLFVDFLNHDTPVLTGAEKISRKIGAAMFYTDVRRERRGHYVCRFVQITPDASSEEQFLPTRRYWQMLEESIRRQPHLWLWSHNRWKRTRQGFMQYFTPDEADRRISSM